MANKETTGYGNPPKHSRWKKGESGNPKGRPKSRSDLLNEAAAILSEPVRARTPDGQIVSLDGFEAAFLAVCKKGLKGDRPTLIHAINIMLEVQPVVDARADRQRHEREFTIAMAEKLGIPSPEYDD